MRAQEWLNEYAGELGEKARWRREKLKLPPVLEPESDPVCAEILDAYAVISRGRQYAGMAGVPLPLSLHDIQQYLSSRPSLIDRPEFDACIFALDDAYRNDWSEKQKKHS